MAAVRNVIIVDAKARYIFVAIPYAMMERGRDFLRDYVGREESEAKKR